VLLEGVEVADGGRAGNGRDEPDVGQRVLADVVAAGLEPGRERGGAELDDPIPLDTPGSLTVSRLERAEPQRLSLRSG